jgi:peptidyl-prolyl cis-trans isomerase A (cyclophilin A)/peptidyl-prolyl cis-trans isomerase B (cyclophilin B)
VTSKNERGVGFRASVSFIHSDFQTMPRKLLTLFALLLPLGAYAANPQVEVKTNLGSLTIELYADKAPKTVENFLQYVSAGFYSGTIFHRVIDGFMIQGGGFTAGYEQKATRAPIENEAANGLKNEIGTIAMARTREPHSATAQFFINVADNAFLDYRAPTVRGFGYCVFGRVITGMEVVNRIAKLETGAGGPFPQDVPLPTVTIESIRLIGGEQ